MRMLPLTGGTPSLVFLKVGLARYPIVSGAYCQIWGPAKLLRKPASQGCNSLADNTSLLPPSDYGPITVRLRSDYGKGQVHTYLIPSQDKGTQLHDTSSTPGLQ